MNKKAKGINKCVRVLFKNVIHAPSGYESELDVHTELYRILYDKLKKENKIFKYKSNQNRDKLIHSNHYADIRSSDKKSSIRGKNGVKQIFYDMSILGNGYDSFFELKFDKSCGHHGIFKDIRKIMGAKEKSKLGFIINIRNKRKESLYKTEKGMIKTIKTFNTRFIKKLSNIGKSRNSSTTLYYYYLFCNYRGEYIKLIWKIKKSNIKLTNVVYNKKNIIDQIV